MPDIRSSGFKSRTSEHGKFEYYIKTYFGLFILCVLVALIFIYLHPKKYRAIAQISPGVNKEKGNNPKDLKNRALKLITSNDVLSSVAEELALYAPIEKRSALRSSILYGTAPINLKAKNITRLKLTENIPFNFTPYFVIINGVGYPYGKWMPTPYGEFMFSPNVTFKIEKKSNYQFSILPINRVVSELSKGLKVEEVQDSNNLLSVSLVDENRDRALSVLNAILNAYTANTIESNHLITINTAKFINNKLETVEADLLKVEQNLKIYKEENPKIAIGNLGDGYLNKVRIDDKQIAELSNKLLVLDKVNAFLNSSDNNDAINPANVGIDDRKLSDLIGNLYQAKSWLLAKVPASDSVTDKQKAVKVTIVKSQLSSKILSLRTTFKKKIGELSEQTNRYSSILDSITLVERNLVYLQRQQELKTNIYTSLLDKKAKNALSYITKAADRKIVKPVTASFLPISAKNINVLLIAILTAIILGLGYTMIRNRNNF